MCKAQQPISALRLCRALACTSGIVRFLATTTLLLICATATKANQYDDVVTRVRSLVDSPHVRLLNPGKSTLERSIPAFVISDFSTEPTHKARALLIAGQHGNEYNSVLTLLEYCAAVAEDLDNRTLKRCIVIVAPMVNPDGIAANSRLNADGFDINRDWQSRRTLEAQYVNSIIEQWRPHVILDMHEWTGPSDVPGNAIEVAHISSIRQKEAVTELASVISSASELTLIQCSPSSDSRLFHRRYSEQGYASFLLETSADLSYAGKSRSYTTAIKKAIESVSDNVEIRAQLSPASARFEAAAVSQYLKPKSSELSVDVSLWQLAAVMVAYVIILWVLKPLTHKKEAVWSHRFVKCGIDYEETAHPLIKKRKPQPILYRSWSHRRIRSRCVEDASSDLSSEESLS